MPEQLLSETIKVRVRPECKKRLGQIANHEHLDVSDIARRALNEYLLRNARRKGAK